MKFVCTPGDPEYIEPGSDEYNDVIGCSQVADILGFGWNTAKDLFLKKSHRAPDQEHKKIFDRGHRLEPMMSEMINEMGREVKAEQTQFRDPARPWLIAHVDGMFPKWSPLTEGATPLHGAGLCEFKAPGSNMADKMMKDGMSEGYICQGQIGMHVASAAMGQPISWSTYGFLDYDQWELVTFDCPADEGFQRRSLEKIDAFYDCLLRDVPPEPINPAHIEAPPAIKGEKQIITEGPLVALAESLIALEEKGLSELKAFDKAIRSEIKENMGDMALVEIEGLMRYTYKYSKPKEKIDGAGLLAYCEHIVERCNRYVGFINEMCPNDNPQQERITFRRSDWVELIPATRSLRPKRLDE